MARLGAEISADYADKPLHLVGVLKGSAVFVADLVRELDHSRHPRLHLDRAVCQVTASGVVRIRKDLDDPIEGKDVLVVEGICASGLTLSYLLRNFETRNPASLRVCTLLAKTRQRAPDITSTMSATPFRTSSWSATASTGTSVTATCRTSPRSHSRVTGGSRRRVVP